MRPDTLAIMVHAANVGPHARVLCLDATGGVAAAACAERMGGTGTLCCPHAESSRYPLDYARLLNCPRWLAQSARHCALTELLAVQKRINDAAAEGEAPAKKQKTGEPGSGTDAGVASDLPAGAPNSSVQPQVEAAMQGGSNAEIEPLTTAKAEDPSAACRMDLDAPADEPVNLAYASGSAELVREGKTDDAKAASEKEHTPQEKDVGTTERPIQNARAAAAQLRLGKDIPEGFKIPEVIIGAGIAPCRFGSFRNVGAHLLAIPAVCWSWLYRAVGSGNRIRRAAEIYVPADTCTVRILRAPIRSDSQCWRRL